MGARIAGSQWREPCGRKVYDLHPASLAVLLLKEEQRPATVSMSKAKCPDIEVSDKDFGKEQTRR